MRTTLNLDDQLLLAAKHRAVEKNVSLACVIENALRESPAKPQAKCRGRACVIASFTANGQARIKSGFAVRYAVSNSLGLTLFSISLPVAARATFTS